MEQTTKAACSRNAEDSKNERQKKLHKTARIARELGLANVRGRTDAMCRISVLVIVTLER